MKWKLIAAVGLGLSFWLPVTWANSSAVPNQEVLVAKAKKPPRSVTTIDNKVVRPDAPPFKAGERLDFEVTWFGIKGGLASMRVEGFDDFEGQSALHLRGTAITGKAFSLFFKVEDVGESWIHPSGLYSLGYVTNQSEGSRLEFQKVVLDHDKGVAYSHRMIRKKNKKVRRKDQELDLERTHLQDALSMLYYFRAFDLKPGQRLKTHVHTSRKTYEFFVDAVRVEKVKTPAGTFEALKVHPWVKYKGKRQDKGKLTMWITNDEKRMPIKIQSDVTIGKVNCTLINYENAKQL